MNPRDVLPVIAPIPCARYPATCYPTLGAAFRYVIVRLVMGVALVLSAGCDSTSTQPAHNQHPAADSHQTGQLLRQRTYPESAFSPGARHRTPRCGPKRSGPRSNCSDSLGELTRRCARFERSSYPMSYPRNATMSLFQTPSLTSWCTA